MPLWDFKVRFGGLKALLCLLMPLLLIMPERAHYHILLSIVTLSHSKQQHKLKTFKLKSALYCSAL